MRVLTQHPSEFRGGDFVNAHTTLRYRGDTPSLNRFLEGLVACLELEVEVAFRRLPDATAWTVDHDGWVSPRRLLVAISVNSKAIELEQLRIPAITRGSQTRQGTSIENPPPPEDSSAASPGPRSFGPVMERVVPFGAPCAAKYFQFRTGNVFEVGEGPGDTSDHAQEWKRIDESGGVDAHAHGGEDGIQFVGEGCLFTRDPAPDWDTLTAGEAVQRLRQVTWITGVIEAKRQDFPLTYLFKTAGGDQGILQIYDVTPDPRGWGGIGMKMRYKLVSPSAALPPSR